MSIISSLLINTRFVLFACPSLHDKRIKEQERDRKQRIAFPIQLFVEGSADVQIPDVIQVVPVGKWDHPAYGEMEITSERIARFVKQFDEPVYRDLAITTVRDNGMSGGDLLMPLL